MTETKKLPGSNKSKIIKYKKDENVPNLKITELLLSIVILLTTIINKI